MSEVRESIEIEAPVDAVWALVMDPDRLGEWVSAHREVRGVPAGGVREGGGFEQTLCLAGQSFDVRWKLVECAEPKLAVWTAGGPRGSHADVRYELTERDGTTTFDYTNDFELPGGTLGRIGKRVAGSPARRQARKSLKALKRALESA